VAGAPSVPPLARLNKDTPSAQLLFTLQNYADPPEDGSASGEGW
jgi:hypothetical protein